MIFVKNTLLGFMIEEPSQILFDKNIKELITSTRGQFLNCLFVDKSATMLRFYE